MEAYRWECRQREEERAAEYRERQLEAEADARAEAAAEQPERNRQARLKRSAEIERQTREIELRDLRRQVTRQDWWQKSVDRAASNAVQQRYRNTLMGELDAMINPPPPPPEPVIVVEQPEDDSFCGVKIPRWR